MHILLTKQYRQGESFAPKKRIKRKGVLAGKAESNAFAHYESINHADINFHLELSNKISIVNGLPIEHRQLAKLHQKRNAFDSNTDTLLYRDETGMLKTVPKVQRLSLKDLAKNRVYLKNQGVNYATHNGRLYFTLYSKDIVTTHKGRAVPTYTTNESSVKLEFSDMDNLPSLHTILEAAFCLSGKPREVGHHVINVKIEVLNDPGEPQFMGLLGTGTKGKINLHEVTIVKVSPQRLTFDSDTMKSFANVYTTKKGVKYYGLIESLKRYIQTELELARPLRNL